MIILCGLFLINVFNVFSQGIDQKIKTLDSLSLQINLQINMLGEIKDSLETERKKLNREKALSQLDNKFIFAKINSSKTPILQSTEDSKILLVLNRDEEVEILGASDNYLFVRKDEVYGFLSPMFVGKNDPELNDFIDGLTEADKLEKEFQKQSLTAENERKYNENFIKNQNKRIESVKKKYSPQIASRIIKNEIWLGMTKDMAYSSIGFPTKINRTVLANLVSEQWVYANGLFLYFDNDILKAWQD